MDDTKLLNIAAFLGVEKDNLVTKCVVVDQQTLEQLVLTESGVENVNFAQFFFGYVMNLTNTNILWLCDNRDKFVRITGLVDGVLLAEQHVKSFLTIKGRYVDFKMEVDYMHHGQIIGARGRTIKRIVHETGTKIRFPPANRWNPFNKSNQVIVSGSIENVNRARALLRLFSPLLMSFELPKMGRVNLWIKKRRAYVKMIESQYRVKVMFQTRLPLHTTMVLVKGMEMNSHMVRTATNLLMNFICSDAIDQMLVNIALQISPQYHRIVRGRNDENLLNIMEYTRTRIIFHSKNGFWGSEFQVIIFGRVDDAHMAYQLLLGNLPVTLHFKLPYQTHDGAKIMSLNAKYGVDISLRMCRRQPVNVLSVQIRGVEKNLDKIFKARQELIGLAISTANPHIPPQYFMELTSLLAGFSNSLPTWADQENIDTLSQGDVSTIPNCMPQWQLPKPVAPAANYSNSLEQRNRSITSSLNTASTTPTDGNNSASSSGGTMPPPSNEINPPTVEHIQRWNSQQFPNNYNAQSAPIAGDLPTPNATWLGIEPYYDESSSSSDSANSWRFPPLPPAYVKSSNSIWSATPKDLRPQQNLSGELHSLWETSDSES